MNIHSQDIDNESISNIVFAVIIKTKDGSEYYFGTTDDELFIDGNRVINAVDLNEIRSSLVTLRGSAISINLIGVEDDINFQDASIEIRMIDLNKPNFANSLLHGFVVLKTQHERHISINVEPITTKLLNTVGEFYSESCRADFGDDRCGLDTNSYRYNGYVEKIITRRIIEGINEDVDGMFFANGVIEFVSGIGIGFSSRIIAQNAKNLEIFDPLPEGVEIGDKYQLIAGCDKSFTTCRDRFKNIINFRGEPFINGELLESITKEVEDESSNKDSGK